MKKYIRILIKTLAEHWIIALIGSGGIVTTFLGWFYRTHLKNWLVEKHPIETYNWIWLLLLIPYIFLFFYFLISIVCEHEKLKDPQSIKNALHKYLRHCINKQIVQENVFIFKVVDKQQKLMRGSTKKYLKEVISETENWTVISEGDKNIRVKRDDSRRLKDIFTKTRL